MLKSAWAPLSPSIKNIINDVGFDTFFEALLNHETHEYKDLQLLLALAKNFQDTTCTFHFPSIGEVMLTPFDFSVITGDANLNRHTLRPNKNIGILAQES